MWDRVTFKATGKANFKANYWAFVGVSLLLGLLTGTLSMDTPEITYRIQEMNIESLQEFLYEAQYFIEPFLAILAPYAFLSTIGGIALTILVANPLEVGANRYFLESTTFHKGDVGRLGMGFSVNYGNVVLTQFLRNLFIFLWSLLFVIPGIVRSYGYFAVPYILAENPNLDHDRVLELSRQMTMGYKSEIFVTDLSFLGWHLLNAMTLGILGIFYMTPYINGTKAEIYRFLRANAIQQGITSPHELPGMGSL